MGRGLSDIQKNLLRIAMERNRRMVLPRRKAKVAARLRAVGGVAACLKRWLSLASALRGVQSNPRGDEDGLDLDGPYEVRLRRAIAALEAQRNSVRGLLNAWPEELLTKRLDCLFNSWFKEEDPQACEKIANDIIKESDYKLSNYNEKIDIDWGIAMREGFGWKPRAKGRFSREEIGALLYQNKAASVSRTLKRLAERGYLGVVSVEDVDRYPRKKVRRRRGYQVTEAGFQMAKITDSK